MSYSSCLKCGNMVGWYDKYCLKCQEQYGLPDDREFQKTWHPKDYKAEAKAIVWDDLALAESRRRAASKEGTR